MINKLYSYYIFRRRRLRYYKFELCVIFLKIIFVRCNAFKLKLKENKQILPMLK